MKYLFIILFLSNCLFAQTKITGTYDSGSRTFAAGDKTYKTSYFSQGYASITDGTSFGLIDSTGVIVVPVIYETMGYVKEGLVVATKEKKCGFIDKTGKVIVPFIYDLADDFKKGVAIVRKNNKCGIIDKNGKEITPLIYDGMDNFGNDQSGLARVQKGKKWGFIDKKGKEVVPCIYIKAIFFSDGLALLVREDGKSGFVDTSGKVIVPFTEYTRADNFRNGKAEVRKGNTVFFINKKGEPIN